MRLNPTIFAVMPMGKSKRIENKPFVKFNTQFLFMNGYEILKEIFPTFLVCHPKVEIKVREILNSKNVTPIVNNIISDTLNIGPLGALYLTAKNLTCDYIFFVGCDMPFLNTGVIKFMCGQIDNNIGGVVLKREKFEPLHAIYGRKFVLETAEKMIKNNERKISGIIEKNTNKFKVIDINNSELKKFDPEIKFLNDIDTADDLKKT
ncbi:MAG: molybdenum cofactor guanylyltransferase [Candidatus Altarchaeum sp.]|nr:molybdenum cofactor guanylyltransferase [Candidatus Altarchaeum sp.]